MGFAGGVGFPSIDLLYLGLDRLPQKGEEVFSDHFEMQFGGGIPATMINAGRLGMKARIATFVGKDYFSRFILQELDKMPVSYVNLYSGDGMPVTVSSTMVCSQDRSFVSYREAMEITPEDLEQIYQYLKGAGFVVMHAGFLDVYRRLKADGAVQIFDTGWEDDLSIEKYRDYLEVADYYVPNQKEALKITGEDTVEGAAEVLSRYFQDVIIKLDKDGCLLKNRDGMVVVPPLDNVRAVDATGAGDAFMSGFLYGLYHRYPVQDCIRFGNVTGGVCVQGMGCLSRYVNEQELLELAKTIRPERRIHF